MPEVIQLPLLVIRYRYVYPRSTRVMKTYNEDRIHYVLLSRDVAGIYSKDSFHCYLRTSANFSKEIIIVDLATIVIIDS